MQLETVVAALRTRCPSFFQRIAGAAEFKMLPESASLAVPCAFVIPIDDNPGDAMSQNDVRQALTDSFAVVIAVNNKPDERGQSASNDVHNLRAELWHALLGWRPSLDYNGITYEGGTLLQVDRARLWYQFEFGADMEIGPEDGYQATELAGLAAFEGATIKVDEIDPAADPNLHYPGPDGRIETQFSVPQTGTLPT